MSSCWSIKMLGECCYAFLLKYNIHIDAHGFLSAVSSANHQTAMIWIIFQGRVLLSWERDLGL